MNSPTPEMRELARRLITLEVPSDDRSSASVWEIAGVCAKLRVALGKFVGTEGYRSLLLRAMVLAKAEAPCLELVRIEADGSLEGFETLGQHPHHEAGILVVVHLLSLLVTFIGKRLTLGLVRDAWPGASFDDTDLNAEKQS